MDAESIYRALFIHGRGKAMKEIRREDPSFPNGWVIKTYRHMNVPRSDFDDTEQLLKEFHDRSKEDDQ